MILIQLSCSFSTHLSTRHLDLPVTKSTKEGKSKIRFFKLVKWIHSHIFKIMKKFETVTLIKKTYAFFGTYRLNPNLFLALKIVPTPPLSHPRTVPSQESFPPRKSLPRTPPTCRQVPPEYSYHSKRTESRILCFIYIKEEYI